MSSENLREEINNILGNLRQRIELEDDDFHYDAVLEAVDQILSHLKGQIEQMENPYFSNSARDHYELCRQDILSKLQ